MAKTVTLDGKTTLSMFFRCRCTRLHTCGFIGPSTKCACGASLYKKAWS